MEEIRLVHIQAQLRRLNPCAFSYVNITSKLLCKCTFELIRWDATLVLSRFKIVSEQILQGYNLCSYLSCNQSGYRSIPLNMFKRFLFWCFSFRSYKIKLKSNRFLEWSIWLIHSKGVVEICCFKRSTVLFTSIHIMWYYSQISMEVHTLPYRSF